MKEYLKQENHLVTELAPRNKDSISNYNSLDNREMLESDGYELSEWEWGHDGRKYIAGFAPSKPELTADEITLLRKQYRKDHCDDLTNEKVRKTSLGTWTDESELSYKLAMEQVELDIDKLYPKKNELKSKPAPTKRSTKKSTKS